MQTNEDVALEFLDFCESVYKDARHIAKQAKAGQTDEAEETATQLAQTALTIIKRLLTAQQQEEVPRNGIDTLPVHADSAGRHERPFVVLVLCDLINSIDGPGQYMEHEHSVVLSSGEAQRLKRENPAIADYLNEEDPQQTQLLARTEELQALGFATLATQIEAEVHRQVAARNRSRSSDD